MKTALIINRLQPNLQRLRRMRQECEICNVTKGCDAAEKAHFSLRCALNYQMNATKPTSLVAHARKKQSTNFIKKKYLQWKQRYSEKAECYSNKSALNY